MFLLILFANGALAGRCPDADAGEWQDRARCVHDALEGRTAPTTTEPGAQPDARSELLRLRDDAARIRADLAALARSRTAALDDAVYADPAAGDPDPAVRAAWLADQIGALEEALVVLQGRIDVAEAAVVAEAAPSEDVAELRSLQALHRDALDEAVRSSDPIDADTWCALWRDGGQLAAMLGDPAPEDDLRHAAASYAGCPLPSVGAYGGPQALLALARLGVPSSMRLHGGGDGSWWVDGAFVPAVGSRAIDLSGGMHRVELRDGPVVRAATIEVPPGHVVEVWRDGDGIRSADRPYDRSLGVFQAPFDLEGAGHVEAPGGVSFTLTAEASPWLRAEGRGVGGAGAAALATLDVVGRLRLRAGGGYGRSPVPVEWASGPEGVRTSDDQVRVGLGAELTALVGRAELAPHFDAGWSVVAARPFAAVGVALVVRADAPLAAVIAADVRTEGGFVQPTLAAGLRWRPSVAIEDEP